MAAEQAAPAQAEPRHGLRIFLSGRVLARGAGLVGWVVWARRMPPGDMSDSERHQQFDIAVLSVTGAPVILAVWVYFAYALIVWRKRPGDEEDGPPIDGHTGISLAWIIGTSVIVLAAFVFGTVELVGPAGAGAGEGPAPIWKISGITTAAWTPGTKDILQVQVIGQEWWWIYRYPQFGGFESTRLYLPKDTPLEFHVTSLDVIHSFWAYRLGVKADANPGVDNVAYTRPEQLGGFTVRCNELCGLWHGAMFNSGSVVTQAEFQNWAAGVRDTEAQEGVIAALPGYALTYDPTVIRQLGADLVKVTGITGGNGYYYSGAQAGTPGPPVSP